ncbi:hypothetical protein LCGC14_2411400 [marine sediment metagenome]|uniref:Uncharacterized protein n=1 Tax=marine sediment metagenome TaxID=412755 RepID=A0A0F9CEK1_9ZZZZ
MAKKKAPATAKKASDGYIAKYPGKLIFEFASTYSQIDEKGRRRSCCS